MNLRVLSNELQEIAIEELNENPDRLQDDVNYIKEWINKQDHLRCRTDDQWIVNFLRGCKFSLEKTKKKLDLYYTLKTIIPEMCRIDLNCDLHKYILNSGHTLLINKTDNDKTPRLVFVKPSSIPLENYDVVALLRFLYVIIELMIQDDDVAVINGASFIFDMSGVTISHFLHCTPTYLKKMFLIGQDANPIRLKSIHIINPPTGFETIYFIIRSLLNEKTRNRLYLYNKNFDDLYKHFTKEMLPKEVGGILETEKLTEFLKSKIAELEDWLMEDSKYGTDESKRPDKEKSVSNVFGIEGSFRQLSVD